MRKTSVLLDPIRAKETPPRSFALGLALLIAASSIVLVTSEVQADSAKTASVTLPMELGQMSAVSVGANAYIFGGWDGSSVRDEIVRYAPSTNTVTTMSATLPTP